VHCILAGSVRLSRQLRSSCVQLVRLGLSLLATFDPDVEAENVREARAAGIEAIDFIDDNPWNIGSWLLDLLAMTLPASKVASCVRDAAVPWLQEAGAGTSVWKQKYAAIMGLAVISQVWRGGLRGCRQ
jgi:hypothetical protein